MSWFAIYALFVSVAVMFMLVSVVLFFAKDKPFPAVVSFIGSSFAFTIASWVVEMPIFSVIGGLLVVLLSWATIKDGKSVFFKDIIADEYITLLVILALSVMVNVYIVCYLR